MPLRVTAVHPTPNPNAMKFDLNGTIAATPASFFDAASGRDHPVAGRLFAIEGVSGLLLLGTFVTVSKRADATWRAITPAVKKVLNTAEAAA